MSQPGLTQPLPARADSLLEIEITPELVERHGLSAEEYQKIVSILGREPNITELGIFSVMWSEHCSYKTSKPLLRLMPTPTIQRLLCPSNPCSSEGILRRTPPPQSTKEIDKSSALFGRSWPVRPTTTHSNVVVLLQSH